MRRAGKSWRRIWKPLGPTFIKLGQLLSSRGALIPAGYAEALERLQDSVEPFPFEEVERIVTEELGVRISKGFESFDREPVASASLGQVHRARLRDGRDVVVKVQRPNIRQRITEDLEAFDEIARVLEKHTDLGERMDLRAVLEEFRKTIFEELDYRREARIWSGWGRTSPPTSTSWCRSRCPTTPPPACSPWITSRVRRSPRSAR